MGPKDLLVNVVPPCLKRASMLVWCCLSMTADVYNFITETGPDREGDLTCPRPYSLPGKRGLKPRNGPGSGLDGFRLCKLNLEISFPIWKTGWRCRLFPRRGAQMPQRCPRVQNTGRVISRPGCEARLLQGLHFRGSANTRVSRPRHPAEKGSRSATT